MQTAASFDSLISKFQSFLLSYESVGSRLDFFYALAPFLAEQLNADYICIDKLHGNLEAETLAVWYDGHLKDNYNYKLKDTPCGMALEKEVCTIAEKVRFLFPNDEFLQTMGAESYAGMVLKDSHSRPIGLIAVISRIPADDLFTIESLLRMVSYRASAELEHLRTNRAFEGLSLAAHAILTSHDESEMLRQVCKIVVDYCEYSMMWIGFVNYDDCKSITPVAYGGSEEDYLKSLNLTWADTERGRGPSGTAARIGKTVICMNTATDTSFEPWRKDALERGYYSNMAIPMIFGHKVLGVISVYAATPDFFWNEDLHILNTLSNDLSTGIISLRLRKERDNTLYDLHMANQLLEVTVSERTAILTDTNRRLKQEIEKRKANEKLLAQAELKYRTVADFTYDGESWMGTDGRFIYISPSFERLTGYPAEEFIKNSSLFYQIAHPEDREMAEKHFDHIIYPNDDVCNLKFRIITKSGETRWIGHTCQPVYNSEGEWTGQRGSNRDITFEKEAEQILINSQKQLRALTIRLDEIAEQERKNVARHIHDELGHLLTALKFDLDNIALEKNKQIGELESEFKATDELITSLIQAVRKLSTELRPEILDHLGLLPALEWHIREFRKRTRICCTYKIEDIKHQFTSRETTVTYRILQETLTNIARHADAQHVQIFVVEKENKLVMRIIDDGKGFNFDEYKGVEALGLLGMKERALSIGAQLNISSIPGKGTTITFSVSLKNTTSQPQPN